MRKSKLRFMSMVQPKYLILGHCGIETLFKKDISLWKSLFNLEGTTRKLTINQLIALIISFISLK